MSSSSWKAHLAWCPGERGGFGDVLSSIGARRLSQIHSWYRASTPQGLRIKNTWEEIQIRIHCSWLDITNSFCVSKLWLRWKYTPEFSFKVMSSVSASEIRSCSKLMSRVSTRFSSVVLIPSGSISECAGALDAFLRDVRVLVGAACKATVASSSEELRRTRGSAVLLLLLVCLFGRALCSWGPGTALPFDAAFRTAEVFLPTQVFSVLLSSMSLSSLNSTCGDKCQSVKVTQVAIQKWEKKLCQSNLIEKSQCKLFHQNKNAGYAVDNAERIELCLSTEFTLQVCFLSNANMLAFLAKYWTMPSVIADELCFLFSSYWLFYWLDVYSVLSHSRVKVD